jgi:hypothetical protein
MQKVRPARLGGWGAGRVSHQREHAGLRENHRHESINCLQSGFFLLGFRNLRHNRRIFWTTPRKAQAGWLGADATGHAGSNGERRMKNFSVATVFVVGAACLAPAAFAAAASECSISMTLANWGEKSTGAIAIAPKESCQFPIKLPGTISSSEISQKPSRGKLKKINASTYQYTAKARYRGTDAFAITATGKDEKTSGTSVISIEVTIK